MFNGGRTFGNYANFARKDSSLLGGPASWHTTVVANKAKGLKSAPKGKFRRPNFIRSDLAIKAISFEPFGSQLAQLAFCAYLFALRAPIRSITTPAGFPSDSVELMTPAADAALVTARWAPKGPHHLLRLSSRKNLPTGCFMRPPLRLPDSFPGPQAALFAPHPRLVETCLLQS